VCFERLGENTVYLDCDVIEADGGTRSASITGAQVALAVALARGAERGLCAKRALSGAVAGVSVGIVDGRAVLDLDYAEDAAAEVDMNVAMTRGGKFVEIQGSGEGGTFDDAELALMLRLARRGIGRLLAMQRRAMAEWRS